MPAKCPHCGFENPENAKFCNECGSQMAAAEPVRPDAGPGATAETASSAPPEPRGTSSPPPEKTSEPAPSAAGKPAPTEPPERGDSPLLLTPSQALVPAETPPASPGTPPGPSAPSSEPASSDAAAELPPKDHPVEMPAPRHPFGERFKIIEELGSGNLGTIYRVFDKAMERELALRAVKPEIAEKKEVFEGFSREMKTERGIVHKNIARIFELNAVMGSPFITMEYVPGEDLKFLIKARKRLPVKEAFGIAKQVFNGLSEAHRLGALHLDLHPGNIILDKEGTAKILDLGIVRMFRSKGITRGVAGMPQYMSPEQVEGREADAASDIYAAGAIFYEMLTGSLPPVAQTPRNPKEINPEIPSKLSLLVLKCLEKDKSTRYQRAKEIWEELEQMETGIQEAPVEPAPTPPAERPTIPVTEERKPDTGPRAEAAEEMPPPEKPRREPRVGRRGFPIQRRVLFPVLVVAAVFILSIFLWRAVFKRSEGPAPGPTEPPRISLAVVPFEDQDPAKGNEYLGEALAETVARSLKNVAGLFLADTESSFMFKGADRGSRIIGRRLQVDHYLAGNIQSGGNTLGVDVELVRADTGTILWSGRYERAQGEFEAITEEIGQAVVQNLGLTRPPQPPPPGGPPKNPSFEAFDAYAQGLRLANRGEMDDLEKALGHFEQAVVTEPDFTLAFEALADAYVQLAEGRYWPPERAFTKAKESSLKALLLDPRCAGAHVSLATAKTVYDWDFEGAEKGFREALRIDPDCAPAHYGYALLLSALGRHSEAIAEIRAAQALNPLSSAVNARAGLLLYLARLYDQADAELKKAVAADPGYSGHYYNSALVQIQLGRFADAVASLRRAAELGADSMETDLLLAHVYARQDQRAEVGRILTSALKAAKDKKARQVSIASVYAGLNERDQVIACLDIACNDRESGLLFLKVHPIFDLIRADPRYLRLLQRVGLGR